MDLPSVRARFGALALLTLLFAACGGGSSARPPATPSSHTATKTVFEMVVPSVVAIDNDTSDDRKYEEERLKQALGQEASRIGKVIDVSLKKQSPPHGTGFMIEGGKILTAAHVILRPDRIRVHTRDGKMVPARLVHIDEVRDVAVLETEKPLPGVPPLKLDDRDISVGHKVWALGHTGNGLWQLSWGISEGIASGIVEMLGAKLVLYDAAVYPGFSGGPVVTIDEDGKPAVVGVNHAILFTGGLLPVASISSAASVSDIRDVIARKPPKMEKILADYAQSRARDPRAQLFITQRLFVHRDSDMMSTATIFGNAKSIEIDETAHIPVAGMVFGLAPGSHRVTFELLDPHDRVAQTIQRPLKVLERERVGFVSAKFQVKADTEGRYDVLAKMDGKVIGSTSVWVEDSDDDDQPVDDDDTNASIDPSVDIFVAAGGKADPLTLLGVRAAWSTHHYPRRMGFTWFAQGSRGWAGNNVAITAFVLDDQGKIVGRGVGCIRSEIRPEAPWSCMGTGGTPMLFKEGRYDVVFALNEKPVAVWPMEAIVRSDGEPGSPLDKWLKSLKRRGVSAVTKMSTKPGAAEKTTKPQGAGKSGDADKGAKDKGAKDKGAK